jgi:hypothetical protein
MSAEAIGFQGDYALVQEGVDPAAGVLGFRREGEVHGREDRTGLGVALSGELSVTCTLLGFGKRFIYSHELVAHREFATIEIRGF